MGAITVKTCVQCDEPFIPPLRSPGATMCSKACRNRAYYLAHPKNRERKPRKGRDLERRRETHNRWKREHYDPVKAAEYQQRPEVKERNRLRNRARYVPHPRVYTPRPKPAPLPEALPAPYGGHRWLDMAREVVGDPYVALRGSEWADRRDDELGEVTLAILEGRDPEAALKDYRRREFVPRHMTQSISEWQGDSEEAWRVDTVVPTTPSAEEEVVAKETVLRKVRYHGGQGKAQMGTPRQSTPTNRRQNAA